MTSIYASTEGGIELPPIALHCCAGVSNGCRITNLETFVAAVKSSSFAGAARLLGISPAMVGRRIQALEEESRRPADRAYDAGAAADRAGREFLCPGGDRARGGEPSVDDITRTEPGKLSGRIRATGPATLGIHRLAGIVARFCEDNPAVTVELSLNDRRADLIAEGFDVAIRVGELQASAMIAAAARHLSPEVRRFTVRWVAAYGLPATPEELKQHRCLLKPPHEPPQPLAVHRPGRRLRGCRG